MGNLDNDAGTVAGFGVASASTPVGEVDQYLNPLINDVVAFLSPHIGHKSNAASIMLMGRIVQPLRRRQTMGPFFLG